MIEPIVNLLISFIVSLIGISLGVFIHKKEKPIYRLFSLIIFYISQIVFLLGSVNFLNDELNLNLPVVLTAIFIVVSAQILANNLQKSCDITYKKRGWDSID